MLNWNQLTNEYVLLIHIFMGPYNIVLVHYLKICILPYDVMGCITVQIALGWSMYSMSEQCMKSYETDTAPQ